MPEVFISYRQTSDTERQRVRAFAERLRSSGITVILDQFLLDAKAGGPPEDWAKWSTDQANQTERVIIIGGESWFLCYDGKQPPGTGLGAACEARNLRRRIYRNAGINEDIRVVIFDEANARHISADLELYHRFHADRDFDNIVRWLKDTQKSEQAEEWGQKNKDNRSHSTAPILLPTSSPRSNLPTIQRFFGRDAELAKLLPDLHPDATGWGALIDGPGGMGKTTLAIRAAERAAPGHFDDILFLSAKQTAMDPHGPHDESPFAVSGFTREPGRKPMAEDAPGFECLARRDEGAYPQRSVTEEQRSQTLKDQADSAIGFRPGSPMLDAIARRLQKPEITQAPADERPRLLIDALTGTRTLLVLDNLETLTDADQRSLFAFLGHLPRTCKALLTSRPLVIATGRRLKLQQLDQTAALQTLADIARDNPDLAAAPEPDRLRLITETGGNTLLLTWTAWQVGSGYCTTIADALAHLRSCPPGNDPLEFIFGDLLARFTPEEERIVATLSYPTEPIPVTATAEVSGVDEPTTRRALKLLTNRSIVVPQEGEEKYALVPMVAEFIRHERPEVVKQMGDRLADRAFRLIIENGYGKHALFPILEAAWAVVAPAFAIFAAGENDRLQTVCDALHDFFNYTGRWEEWLVLSEMAESKAVTFGDYGRAGWRAYDAGCVHDLRKEADAVLSCAGRVAEYWHNACKGPREFAIAMSLVGRGHRLLANHAQSISAFQASRDLHLTVSNESHDMANASNALATAEMRAGDYASAERDFREAYRIAQLVGHEAILASSTGNLAEMALALGQWPQAETLARQALPISTRLGHKELIAADCRRLAKALVQQSKFAEAKPYAQQAVDIFTHLGSPNLSSGMAILAECKIGLAGQADSLENY